MRISNLKSILALAFLLALFSTAALAAGDGKNSGGATKKERELILEGNKLYRAKKFRDAGNKYSLALKENPESSVASFNLGLSNLQIATSLKGQDSVANQLIQQSASLMSTVGERRIKSQNLSSRAFYNLGNINFHAEQYGQAIAAYKQALRLNPSDNAARRNLRIAQKKQQQQDKDNQNKQQNKQQNQQNPQNQQQNQQNPQNQQQNQQTQPPRINNQTSQQILDAVERKENQTRMKRLASPSEPRPAGRSRKNW